MKVLDLTITSAIKRKTLIRDICGGQSERNKAVSGFGKGISGFTFLDKLDDGREEIYQSNLEFYNAGIGIYNRNIYSNFLLLIAIDEIKDVHIHKAADFIVPKSWSIYSLLRRLGVNGKTAEKMLMPIEIIEAHVPTVTFHLKEEYVTLNMDNISIEKFEKLLKKSLLKDLYKCDIEPVKVRSM